MNKDLVSIIVETLQECNGQQEEKIPAEFSGETLLFGNDGMLDSVGLVTLIVAVEQAIEDEFGISIILADEKAMSEKKSPYRTINSLAEYADRLLQTEM